MRMVTQDLLRSCDIGSRIHSGRKKRNRERIESFEDVVSTDPSHPWSSSTSSAFSYQLDVCLKHLDIIRRSLSYNECDSVLFIIRDWPSCLSSVDFPTIPFLLLQAVLLLKPNITLYSTDSTPANCGPLWTPSRLGPGGGRNPVINGEKPVERTCECLTQTLGCYGCGSSIGYSILSPCSRCTSSVVKHQRSSNGHRTVLHCSEISVRERRYVPGEPGVNAAIPPPPPPSNPLLSSPSNHHHGLGIRYLSSQSQQYNASYPYSSNSSSRSSSPYSSSPNASFNHLDPDDWMRMDL